MSESQVVEKVKCRPVVLVMIYPSAYTSRTGKRSPVGKHIRAEIRDADDDELLATHAYSPFSTSRLRTDSERRGEDIIRRYWDVESEQEA